MLKQFCLLLLLGGDYVECNALTKFKQVMINDVNECIERDTSSCVEGRGTCVNTIGSWVCDCERGFINPDDQTLQVCVGDCEDGWEWFDLSCYKADSRDINYDRGEEECVKEGGHLVSINSAEEDKFVDENVMDPAISYALGLTDEASEGNFVWRDGSSTSFTKWAALPNNAADRDCVYAKRDGREWLVELCQGNDNPFVCEKPLRGL